MKKKLLTPLLILGMVFTGCMNAIEPVHPEGRNPEETEQSADEATIRFNINQDTYTRSSITINEGELSDVNIYAFRDGLLYSSVYSTTPNTVSMKLKKGTSYNLYAVANMGAMDAMAKEEDFIRNFAVKLTSIKDLDGRNPLAWSYSGYSLSDSTGEISMAMDRIYSKINFTLDKGTLRGLEVKSVRLCQAARTVRPFSRGGSRALNPDDITDGDYASASDLEKLNGTGKGVFFYTLENRQGTLLPDNMDPWKKVPDNIPAGNLCTYIEVQATFREGFFYSGCVTYRFYLGQDSTTNFDIFRNNDMNIALILTGDNFGEGKQNISWKVYSDTDLNPNGFSTYEIRHLHNSERMFVGERFELDATLSPDLFNHVDQNPDNVELCAIDPDTKKKISCISVKSINKISSGNNGCKLRFIGSITRQSSFPFSYALFDRRSGKLIADYSSEGKASYRTMQTNLIISQTENCTSITDTLLATSRINGPAKTYYVHAFGPDPATNQQANLHKTGILSGTTPESTRSLDLEMFKDLQIYYTIRSSWNKVTSEDESWKADCPSDKDVLIKYTPAPQNSDKSYVGSFTVEIKNDGQTDHRRWQKALGDESYRVNKGSVLKPIPKSHNLGFSIHKPSIPEGMYSKASHNAFLSIMPAKVTLKFTSVSVIERALSFVIDNPSKVPFKFRAVMELPFGYSWTSNSGKKTPLCIFCEKEGNDKYEYNRSRFISISSFNLLGESDKSGKWISENEWKLNSTFRALDPQHGLATNPNLHIILQTYFNDWITDNVLYMDDSLYLMRDDMLDVKIEGNPSGVVLVNQQTMIGESAARLNLKGRIFTRAHRTLYWGRNYFTPDSPLLEFKKPGQHNYLKGGGLIVQQAGSDFQDWHVRLFSEGYSEYKKFGAGPKLTREWNMKSGSYVGAWETEFMNHFMTDAYKKEYWHTMIHTKAGHHIVYPRIYQVNMDIKISMPDNTNIDIYYVDVGELNESYSYKRDHIQRSEKNDDSYYDYTVNINCTYNGASPGAYYYLYAL